MSRYIALPSCILVLFISISITSIAQNESIQNNETMNYHFMIHERSLKNGDTITKYIYVDCQTGEECLDSMSEKSINDDFQVLKDTLMQSEQFDDPFAKTLSSAGKTDRSIGDIPASVVLITKKEIQSLGYQSVEEILINVPGLYGIEQHDWTGQGMNIGARGFYSPGFNNEMVILVNGVNMLEDHNSFYPLARLEVPIESIERIEVIRGPMSVIYGSGAFLGSINIITDVKDNDNNEKVSGIVSLGKGIQRDFRTTAVIRANTNLGHQSFSFGSSNFAGPDQPFDSIVGSLGDSKTTKGVFNSRRTFINYSGNFQKFKMNLSYSQAQKKYIFGLVDLPEGHNSRLSGGNAQIAYSDQLGRDSVLIFNAKIAYFSHQNKQDYSYNYDNTGGFESNAVEAEVNGMWMLQKSKLKLPIELTTGLYYRRAFGLYTSYTDGFFKWYRLAENSAKENYGLVLNSFFDLTPERRTNSKSHQLQLIAGVRLEYIPEYDIELNYRADVSGEFGVKYENNMVLIPRAGLIYKVNQNNIVKLLYGSGIKQPSFIQVSDRKEDINELNQSTLTSLELNFLNTTRSGEGRKYWTNQVNFSLFYNQLDSLIERFSEVDIVTGNISYSSGNQGQISTLGGELTNQFNFNKLQISLSYTFQTSTNSTNFKTYPIINGTVQVDSTNLIPKTQYSPQHLGYANLIWEISDHLSLGTKLRYVGSMFSEYKTDWDADLQDIIGYDESSGKLKEASGYLMADAQLSITNLWDRLRIDLNVKNIFDTDFHIPYGSNNTSWASRGMMGRGRWFMLTAKYSF